MRSRCFMRVISLRALCARSGKPANRNGVLWDSMTAG
jgi:hypothetical protein